MLHYNGTLKAYLILEVLTCQRKLWSVTFIFTVKILKHEGNKKAL